MLQSGQPVPGRHSVISMVDRYLNGRAQSEGSDPVAEGASRLSS
jgi:hypothetical protein